MEFLTLNHSSYPRIGSKPDEQILRRTIAQRDHGEKTDADVHAAEDHMAALTIDEQQDAGIDIVTDGLVRWSDPISHLAGKLAGISIDGLLRFFDTNFYFRQPEIRGEIARIHRLVVDEFRWAAQKSNRPVKPVLTGPYTLAQLSIHNDSTRSLEALVISFAQALAAEVHDLAAAGAELIQIDEPALLKNHAGLSFAFESLALIAASKGPAELALALYFGDVAPVYVKLQDLPLDTLILDFTYSPKVPELIKSAGSIKQLGFGMLDGRNTRLEDQAAVLHQLEAMLRRIEPERAYLTTSCGLEYLPRDRARLKLRHLAALKRSFLGEIQ